MKRKTEVSSEYRLVPLKVIEGLTRLMDDLIEEAQSGDYIWGSKRSRDRGNSWSKTKRVEAFHQVKSTLENETYPVERQSDLPSPDSDS